MRVVTEVVPRALLADLGVTSNVGDLLAAIEEHDNYTGSHSYRVSVLAARLARLLGLDDASVETVRRAGLVHDIGKLQIPREILRKQGPLTEDEQAILQMHPITGATMVAGFGMNDLVAIVLHHHERWDGRGYPTGVSGMDIPIESRIVSVAGAYDVMTNPRGYSDLVAPRLAVEEVERCAGWQFDPLVARALKLAFEKDLLDATG